MPVTTFDIPEDLFAFIDELVNNGTARSRREVVIRALEIYAKLQVHKWNGPLITINGVRNGIISKGTMAGLLSGLAEGQLRQTGRRMGKTLRDLGTQLRIDISLPENHAAALQILEDFGWGRFTIDRDRINVTGAFVPIAVLHGYLEGALSITLTRIETTEEIAVFEKEIVPRPLERAAGRPTIS